MKSAVSKLNWVLLPITLVLALFPIRTAAELKLGPLTLPSLPADNLIDYTPIREGLHSGPYLQKVGGIAFGAVAKSDLAAEIAKLEYDPRLADGNRLVVTFRDDRGIEQVVNTTGLYDWQLFPIIQFARDKQEAILTLWGTLRDSEQTKRYEKQEDHIINYHPQLKNTLLGLRLLQADLFIFSSDPLETTKGNVTATFETAPADLVARCCRLPQDDRGTFVLGEGEVSAEPEKNFETYLNIIRGILPELNRSGLFRSYVITDYGQTIRFSVEHSKLILTGHPYWYCWRLQLDNDNLLNELSIKLREDAKNFVRREYRWDQRNLKADALRKKYSPEYLLNKQKEVYENLLRDELEDLQGVVPMPALSAALSEAIRQNNLNPPVYQALTNMMRYAAFFRYVQSHARMAYSSFLKTLGGRVPSTHVATPTVIPRRE